MLNYIKSIISFYAIKLETSVRLSYRRILPWYNLLDDRWERAKRCGFGKGTSIYSDAYIFGDVIIGSNCWIGPFVILDGLGSLEIGDNCQISAGVHVYTHNTTGRNGSGDRSKMKTADTIIGNNVYIGPNCVISMGVRVEDNCVIGACSYVNKNVIVGPEGSTWFGVPAKRIR